MPEPQVDRVEAAEVVDEIMGTPGHIITEGRFTPRPPSPTFINVVGTLGGAAVSSVNEARLARFAFCSAISGDIP